MKLHELTRPDAKYKLFKLKGGKQTYDHAHMNGDRRRVCISRTEGGATTKRYIKPHTEVEIVE